MTSSPKYMTIKNKLVEMIRDGALPDGRLPSIKKIAEENDVSLMTANQAVKSLKDDGLVICHPDNRGTVVVERRAGLLRSDKDFSSPIGDLKLYSRRKIKIGFFNPEYFSPARAMWDDIIKSFQDKYPWIEVEIAPEKTIEDVIDGGGCRDVMHVIGRDVGHWRRHGLTLSLEEFASSDKEFLSSIHPNALKSCVSGGELCGVPVSMGVPMLFMNEKNLSKCGIGREDVAGRGWEGLASAVEKAGKSGFRSALRLGLWSYWSLFMGDAVRGVTDHRNDAALLRSIEILRRLHARESYVLYGGGPPLAEDFFKRDGAILAGYSSFMCSIDGKRGWRAAMMPVEKGGRLTCETCVCCLGANSKRREEAWLFVKYLASEEAQRKLSRAGSNFPVLPEIMREMEKTPAFEGLGLSSALEKAERIPLSSQILYILYENIIDPVLERHFEGGLSASSVLDIARPRISEILRVYLRNC